MPFLKLSLTFAASLALALVAAPVAAVETQITVLGVTTSTADIQRAAASLQVLKNGWSQSDLSTIVTIDLANAGVPEPISGMTGSGDILSQHDEIAATSNIVAKRDLFDADVVIVFTGEPSSQACGFALHADWTRQSVPDNPPMHIVGANGLDLRRQNNDYYVIVGTKGVDCELDKIAGHEFGHLLGAGHYDLPPFTTFDPYLFPDSRAHVRLLSTCFPSIGFCIDEGWKTFVAEPKPSTCTLQTTLGVCVWENFYSKDGTARGDDDADNAKALQTTALSVANYYEPPGGGGGGSSGPPPPECDDGWDNDMDGQIDWDGNGSGIADSNCDDYLDDSEGDIGGGGGGGGGGCDPLATPDPIDKQFVGCHLGQAVWLLTWPGCSATDIWVLIGYPSYNVATPTVPSQLVYSHAPATVTVQSCTTSACGSPSDHVPVDGHPSCL